jgi:hypothetical protein
MARRSAGHPVEIRVTAENETQQTFHPELASPVMARTRRAMTGEMNKQLYLPFNTAVA